ncbi:MAG TPA: hypothetical protein PK082_03785, partial [Phycisphaerae bacterium]|nr:hypothetical protein [Phycisphaerae bacterium]
MDRRTVAAVMACLLGAGAAAQQSQPATEPAGAAKYDALVRETYAQRLAAVKASATDQDDVELARDLLTSAFAEDTPAPLRAALARKALELTRPVGTPAAVRLAEQALGLLDATEPLPPLARSQVRLDVALQALNRGRVDRLPAAQIQALFEVAGNNNTAAGTSTLTSVFVNGANESAVTAVNNLATVNSFFQNVD